MRQGFSEPEFYGDLVYKLKKIVGSNNFSAHITFIYCNRLHAWWSAQSLLATLLSSLIARRWVRLLTLLQFGLKDLSVDEIIGPDALAVCWAHGVYLLDFVLFRYSVLFTVESLSLLYLLFIS